MPRRKPSPGRITIKTVHQDEFQRWLCYELATVQRWNPEQIKGGILKDGWEFQSVHEQQPWRIAYNKHFGDVTIWSDLPTFRIRKGLTVNMGLERIEVE